MPQQEKHAGNDDEILGEVHRYGAPVIKTTIEMDKGLYLKMKEKVARSNSSIRDFLTTAAREKLTQEDRPKCKEATPVNIIEEVLQNNTFIKKVLTVIEKEVRPPFSLALVLTKLERHQIGPEEFSPSDLSDKFLEDLIEPVNSLSGPVAAKDLKDALVELRRG
jgi:hypothetical protein